MYQVCPSCKKLIEEKEESCPYCGRNFTRTTKKPTIMWCNHCRIKVTPKEPLLPSTGSYNPLMAAVVGDTYRDYFLTKRSMKGNQVDQNPRGLTCPKCSGRDLTLYSPKRKEGKLTPIEMLKRRLAQGEITLVEYQQLRKALE